MNSVLRVLTGPTAVGKTEWALRWAERQGAEIISCDSLLFYRGMDIGTAKPTVEERRRVPHHLIDQREVTAPMDITDFVRMARAAAQDILSRGRPVLVTGGSGFYLKSFFAPVADRVETSAALRAEVAGLSLSAAVDRLRALNPGGLGALDTANPRRVARALERCLASGKTLATLAAEFAQQPGPFAEWRVELTRLERPPAELERRIDERVAEMLRAGLVDEVRGLRLRGLEQNPSAVAAIGYRETLEMLDGRITADELGPLIARHTRGLVKKQRTWFRTQLPAHRALDASSLQDCDELFASR